MAVVVSIPDSSSWSWASPWWSREEKSGGTRRMASVSRRFIRSTAAFMLVTYTGSKYSEPSRKLTTSWAVGDMSSMTTVTREWYTSRETPYPLMNTSIMGMRIPMSRLLLSRISSRNSLWVSAFRRRKKSFIGLPPLPWPGTGSRCR